jgi:hypothetical protein
MELIDRPRAITPFDTAPDGSKLVGHVAIGQRADGSFALDWRLPSGVPFNANNPAHIFGLFVVQNAQQLMGLAMRQESRAIEQTNEIIAVASLPRS